MKVSIPTLLLSTAFGILVFTIITFVIVWLGFPAEKPQDSFKDALDFSGGVFAGSTTFGAAIVAGFLFNDWRVQHNKDIESQLIFKTLDLLDINYFGLKPAIDSIKQLIQFCDLKLDVRSTEFIQIILDPYHLKKISMYEKQVKKLNPEKNISIEFSKYYGIYEEIVKMTENRVSYYNDFIHRNLSSPSSDRLYDCSFFTTDESLPTNYLKVVGEYETAFETLIEKLTELNKADA